MDTIAEHPAPEGNGGSSNLPLLRSKLKTTSLFSVIRDIVRFNPDTTGCCHVGKDDKKDVGKDGKTCGCTPDCWKNVAALLCKYELHDESDVGTSAMEHAEKSSPGSPDDLSFASGKSEKDGSHCSDSSCQSQSSGEPDNDTPEKTNDTVKMHDHHHKRHSQSGSASEKSDTTSIEEDRDQKDDMDPRISPSLNTALLGLPHALVTKHHHHYQVQKVPPPCAFHQSVASRHMAKLGEDARACAWIKGILLLVFENSQVGNLCCATQPDDTERIAARRCCLEDHSIESELGDSVDSLPSDESLIGSTKTLRQVSLAVTGMTCTTCETKLFKALRDIRGVVPKGTKGAHIWYDSKIIGQPKEQICAVVQKKTGFKCKILPYNDRAKGDRFKEILQVRLSLPDGVGADAVKKYIKLLKGVEKVYQIPELGPKKPLATRFMDFIRSWGSWGRQKLPGADPEKGMVGRSSKVFEIRYDPHTLHARNLLQYIRSYSRANVAPELVNTEDIDNFVARQAQRGLRRLLWRTIMAVLFTLPILIVTWTPSIKTNVPAATEMNPVRLANFIVLQVICFILATVVQLCGLPIFIKAYRSLIHQSRLDMDCLITLSTGAAYLYSCVFFVWNIQREATKMATGQLPSDAETERHDPIFETSTLLITLILAGRLLTGYIRHWATNRITVSSLQEKYCERSIQATYARLRNRQWKKEDVRLLHYGDIILSQTGQTIVTDGVVINGEATVDESHLTGEARPAQLQPGSSVIAGSKIVEGRLEYRVTKLAPENTIASMKRLVTTATGSRPRLQSYADRLATWLTPAILIVAVLAFAGWMIYYRVAKRDTTDVNTAVFRAITIGITVLAISCPCAVALAVPTVLIFSNQLGSKNGIVVKSPASLEKAVRIRMFVADKTGTLTTGNLQVTCAHYYANGIWTNDTNHQEVQAIQRMIHKLVAQDHHPVAKAVFGKLKEEYPDGPPPSDEDKRTRSIVGKGIEGVIAGRHIRGGKPGWVLKENLKNFDQKMLQRVVQDATRTPFIVVDVKAETILAIFGLEDTIRPEAADVIAQLQAKQIEVFMLSGDQTAVCKQVAAAVGIPSYNVVAECSPEDKALRIQMLQTRAQMDLDMLRFRSYWLMRFFRWFRTPRRYVLFLGDGTNDAAALTQADIGVTMSNCTDIAAGCADVGILSSSLTGVLALMALSEKAMHRIKWNFAWAIKYNLGAILVATGIVRWGLPAQYAGIGEAISVAPVFIIANSILWRKLKY
ncbi:hypothetical protein DRE_02236 [Drechslerella stenobrocha 248]|uniref:P-type ATPase A domain-containing protein n=1 Tax=Drechslerella stenobrocha 248 TaxID=1043628 RepID=W7I8U7_9PEZI|nr:hypothetical protein DRE_02236 [Drechslerella stenobrocha 248]